MPPVTFEITPSEGSIRARDILQFLILPDKLETSVEMDWIKEYRAPKKQKCFQSKRRNETEGVNGISTPIFSNHFSRMNRLFQDLLLESNGKVFFCGFVNKQDCIRC